MLTDASGCYYPICLLTNYADWLALTLQRYLVLPACLQVLSTKGLDSLQKSLAAKLEDLCMAGLAAVDTQVLHSVIKCSTAQFQEPLQARMLSCSLPLLMLTCMQLNLLLDQYNAQGKGEQYRYDKRRDNALAGVKRQLRFHVDNCAQQSDKQAKLQQELKRQLQSHPAQDFDVWWSDTLQKLRGDHPALWPAGVQPELSTLQAEMCRGQRRGASLRTGQLDLAQL